MHNILASLFISIIFMMTACAEHTQTPEQASQSDVAQAGLELELESGVIKGTPIDGSRVFYGIPYAESTTGSGRFLPPSPKLPWVDIFDATEPGPACAQLAIGGGNSLESAEEDCLHVDVWAPENPPEAPLPVMVWFHGGGFGYGKSHNYPGQHLVDKGVVVVMVSYRLGVMGFLTQPENEGNPSSGLAGNAGIADQQLALEWVRDNIEVFGGDPNNVTLFGQSAGATSICQHLVSEKSGTLFHKAIMQSGACHSLVTSHAASDDQGLALARAVGCAENTDVISCLQRLPVETLVQAKPTEEDVAAGRQRFLWGPNVDGALITNWPNALIAEGQFNQVPVLLGTNLTDGAFFVFIRRLLDISKEDYEATLSTQFSQYDTDSLLSLYPLSETIAPSAALSDLLSDQMFNCPMAQSSRDFDKHGLSVYRYLFTQPINDGFLASLGTIHGAEMPYIFGGPVEDSYFMNEEDGPLAHDIATYWTQFAATGNPNSTSTATWPRFTNQNQAYLMLDTALESAKNLRETYCTYWDAQ